LKIFTIGFTKKSAQKFFRLLEENNISYLLDIRLNNVSQLAGFAKGNDLEYFTNTILGIPYKHDTRLSPTKELLDKYKNKEIDWGGYEDEFKQIMTNRNMREIIMEEYNGRIENVCLLCSEHNSEQCHRRLVAENIANILPNIEIIHL